jgi:LmbE family N-acetylglucosaminyl deacetylase
MTARVAVLLGLLVAPVRAADGVLVVAPHPDDEIVAAGGILHDALAAGRAADVVIVTNGDYYGTSYGLTRQGESVAGLATLGIAEDHVLFLGYPDAGLLDVWNNAPSAADAWLSPHTGRSATYGTRGFGGTDLHTALTGAPGAYNRPTLVADVAAVLALTRPAAVFTTGPTDNHPDHRATYYAVRDAARLLAAGDPGFRPTVYTTVVHDPIGYPFDDFWPSSAGRTTVLGESNEASWPNPSAASGIAGRFDPTVPFVMPPSLPRTMASWAARGVWPVPAAMADPSFDRNLKVEVLHHYVTQVNDVLWAHVKADEFFWAEPLRTSLFPGNVARAATATATSAAPGQGASAAIDGVVDGAPARPGAEWAVAPGDTVATLTLAWPRPVDIDRVVVHDRPGLADHVTAARLVLDDGTVVPLGVLANDGRGDDVVLPAVHRVRRVAVVVEDAVGTPGLAEVEVFGAMTPAPECVADGDCAAADPCSVGRCEAGRCTRTPAADGTACGDDDACNGVERCRAGTCERVPGPDCADGDPCTTDTCRPDGGCEHPFACDVVSARGRGGCRIAFAGTPAVPCTDGDPACDRDGTTDGGCRFDVIACLTAPAADVRCRVPGALGGVVASGRSGELSDVLARLGARLPVDGPSCAGPTAVRVRAGRRRRLAVRVLELGGTPRRAFLTLRCRRAPRGVVHRPPPPLVP